MEPTELMELMPIVFVLSAIIWTPRITSKHNTICRVMVEGPTEDVTNRLAEDIADVVRKELNQQGGTG